MTEISPVYVCLFPRPEFQFVPASPGCLIDSHDNFLQDKIGDLDTWPKIVISTISLTRVQSITCACKSIADAYEFIAYAYEFIAYAYKSIAYTDEIIIRDALTRTVIALIVGAKLYAQC